VTRSVRGGGLVANRATARPAGLDDRLSAAAPRRRRGRLLSAHVPLGARAVAHPDGPQLAGTPATTRDGAGAGIAPAAVPAVPAAAAAARGGCGVVRGAGAGPGRGRQRVGRPPARGARRTGRAPGTGLLPGLSRRPQLRGDRRPARAHGQPRGRAVESGTTRFARTAAGPRAGRRAAPRRGGAMTEANSRPPADPLQRA